MLAFLSGHGYIQDVIARTRDLGGPGGGRVVESPTISREASRFRDKHKETHNMCRRTKQSETAFTLIELLVVIAIMSLLMSILTPSLQKARISAKKATCLATQKNVFHAFGLYDNDWDGAWPAILSNYDTVTPGIGTMEWASGDNKAFTKNLCWWHNALAKYSDVDDPGGGFGMIGGQYQGMNAVPDQVTPRTNREDYYPAYKGRLGCPAFKDLTLAWSQYWEYRWFGYGMNVCLLPVDPSGDNKSFALVRRPSLLKYPAETILIADMSQAPMTDHAENVIGDTASWDRLHYCHVDAVNFLMCDGHAVSWNFAQIIDNFDTWMEPDHVDKTP